MKHGISINRIKRLQYSNLKLHMDELGKVMKVGFCQSDYKLHVVSYFYEQNLRFGQFLGRPAVHKFSAILLKYPTFPGFLMFSRAKKYKVKVSVDCSVRTQKLLEINARKL